ncbi:uncharacterized protein LOC141793996 isoform X2 [Halichoeres trimaculatus]|uniref:uncharacterized protein LOC141793996 isoform X2 n=1 Tax=Halichoeres trimaculatus TaxID=147232 RepID=UPI003D9ED327
MSEFRMKEVRALLNTTMESILRRAMFEIMKIVENSLHDHQLELSQKGEEIVQLKVKLQRVEMKLRDTLYSNEPAAQADNQLDEVQGNPEDVANATTQPLVPETNFEIPEDWCAPVGYEMPTVPDEGSCPSVRLRQLSIPLYPITVKKQEEIHRSITPHQGAGGLRRSKRGLLPMQEGNQTSDKSLAATDQKVRYKKVRGDIAKLLRENAKARESAAVKSDPAEQKTVKDETYPCRFCKAPFPSEFGRDVHERYHKWCRGCKISFSSPESLMKHKPQCQKLIKLMAKKGASGPLSNYTKNKTTTHLKLVNNKQDSPANNTKSVIKSYSGEKKFPCMVCNKNFFSAARQKEHMRVHTGERPFFCGFCPRKFTMKKGLKSHMMRMHKNKVNSGYIIEDLSWTEPLEVAPGKALSASVEGKKLYRSRPFGFKGLSPGWKECGTKVLEGYSCNVCHKVKRTKSVLVEHYRVHTREKPFECPKCHEHFRYQGQFSVHYKKCNQRSHDKAMAKANLPTDLPFSCNAEEKVSLLQDASEST